MTELCPLKLIAEPSELPLSLAEAKTWLRVDHSDEDDLILDLVKGAMQFVEEEIAGHRQLLTATWEVGACNWWGFDFLTLPRPPLQSVTSIKYYDSDGTLATLDTSFYEVRTYQKQPGTIALAYQKFWPVVQPIRNWPITIRFVAGYGTAAELPSKVKQALRLALNWSYSKREPSDNEIKAMRNLLASEGWGFYG